MSKVKSPNESTFKEAISEVIAFVDSYLPITAFEFHMGGSNVKPEGDDPPIDRLIDLLDMDEEMKARRKKIVCAAGKAHEHCFNVLLDTREYAYIVGIFMGAKLAGASRQKLEEIGSYYQKSMSIQPRYTDWREQKNLPKPSA